jgi:hypothetical protein
MVRKCFRLPWRSSCRRPASIIGLRRRGRGGAPESGRAGGSAATGRPA